MPSAAAATAPHSKSAEPATRSAASHPPSAVGTTVIGSAAVAAAAAAPATTGLRSMGRSHRYTRVPSSRVSPSTDEPNTNATMGTMMISPKPSA